MVLKQKKILKKNKSKSKNNKRCKKNFYYNKLNSVNNNSFKYNKDICKDCKKGNLYSILNKGNLFKRKRTYNDMIDSQIKNGIYFDFDKEIKDKYFIPKLKMDLYYEDDILQMSKKFSYLDI